MYWTRPKREARSGAHVRRASATKPTAVEASSAKTTTMASATSAAPAAGPSNLSEGNRYDAD
jgi:hypothetical protein